MSIPGHAIGYAPISEVAISGPSVFAGIEAEASNTLVLTQDVQTNVKFPVADNVLALAQAIALNYNLTVPGSNTLNLTGTPAPTLDIARTLAQVLTLTDVGAFIKVIPIVGTADSTLDLVQTAFVPILQALITQDLVLTQTAAPTLELIRSFDQFFGIEQLAKRGIEDSADNTLTLANEAARGEAVEALLQLLDALTSDQGSPRSSTLALGQSTSVQKTLNITVSNTVTLTQVVIPVDQQACDRGIYNPLGTGFPSITFSNPTSISLVCGADSITLRNPDFGNTESVELRRAFNTSRSGTPKVSRDSSHPKPIRLTFTVQMFSNTKRNELLDFLENCLAEIVTFTDHEGRVRTGVIVNPENAVSTERDGTCGVFTATIEMVVDP